MRPESLAETYGGSRLALTQGGGVDARDYDVVAQLGIGETVTHSEGNLNK
jgi:hypothetical protein